MTLVTRLGLLVALIAFILGISALWISNRIATNELNDLSLNWGNLLASSLGESLALATIDHNAIEAKQTLNTITSRSSTLCCAFIVDFSGHIFVHTFKDGFPEPLIAKIGQPDLDQDHIVVLNGHPIILISKPIIEGMDARLYLGVDGGLTQEAARHLGRTMILPLSILTLLAILVSLLLGRRLVRPLQDITQQLRAHTNKTMPQDATTGSKNEIKALVDAFTVMQIERKQATQGLHQFKNTLDLTLDCVFMFHPDTLYFFYVNTGAIQQVGYTQDELLSMKPTDIKPEYDETSFRKLMQPLIDGSVPILHFATLHRHKNGQDIPVEISLQYIAPAGEEPRFVAIVRDITEQKRARKELETSKARFQAIFESISDAVVVADIDRTISLLNPAVRDMFGYELNELLGKNTEVIYAHSEDYEQTSRERFNFDASGNPLPYGIEYRRKDGSVFWGETLGTRIVSSTREVFGFVGIIRDISERKESEKKLMQYRDHLEELVAEQTSELQKAQADLLKKQRLATLGQLTATVSHELRNPLAAIKSSLYLVRRGLTDADSRLVTAIDRIDRNIGRCDHIVDELLDFTRVREMEGESVVVDDFINEILDEELIPETIQVRRELNLGLTKAYLDPRRMRRALINILENACHAMQTPEGDHSVKHGAELRVTSRAKNGRLEIIVTDNGDGIPVDVLPNIFEPLFSTKGFGVGLGLPTVRQIMKQHGGDIEVHTEIGKGTNMVLWIPEDRPATVVEVV